MRNRYGSELSSDTCSIRNTLLSFSFITIDLLLHYLNLNHRALSIVYTVFDSDEYDTLEELREYTWAEVGSSQVDTSERPYIIVVENTSATNVYLTQQPTKRRTHQNDCSPQKFPSAIVEHNLTSVKKFYQSNTFISSTFHFDTTKEYTATDTTYLSSTLSQLGSIRQSYDALRTNAREKLTPLPFNG